MEIDNYTVESSCHVQCFKHIGRDLDGEERKTTGMGEKGKRKIERER